MLGLLAVSFYVIEALHKVNTMFSAFAISFSNAMFPTLAKILSQFEKHANEERREVQSMALHQDCHFPLCEYGGNHLDYHTSYIHYYINRRRRKPVEWGIQYFFRWDCHCEFIAACRPWWELRKAFRRPKSQFAGSTAINLSMRCTEIFLAGRYTNMRTKLVFLAIWYCPIYPGVLFMCAIALFVNFFTDRFILMRTWKRSPKPCLGSRKISPFPSSY